jgi:signal transduction histidine kinase
MRQDHAAPSDVGPPARNDGNPFGAGDGAGADGGRVVRVVEAVDKQRERLERDIHDGVQQRLVAVRIRLAIAGELANGDGRLRRELSKIGEDLDDAIGELREVTRGIHPRVLTDHGLVAALGHVARATPGPVDVASTGLGRYPAELESAIYYCCREAIQNASKHGGPSVRISVFLHDDACSVGFEVSDDGPGFEVSTAPGGGGLQHMRDRMLLLGGRLSIVSHAGVGTVVSGAISPG